MEQKSASTSKNSDELDEVTEAGLILLSMKHSKLDPETAFNLELTKQSFLGHPISTPIVKNDNHHQTPPRQNRFLRVPSNQKRQREQLPGPPMVESLQQRTGKQGLVEKVQSESDLNSYLERMQPKNGEFDSLKEDPASSNLEVKKKRGRPANVLRKCKDCDKSELQTLTMRRGPYGPGTLCNACGLRWQRQQKKLILDQAEPGTLSELDDTSETDVDIPTDSQSTKP